jgi:hypothetical protein
MQNCQDPLVQERDRQAHFHPVAILENGQEEQSYAFGLYVFEDLRGLDFVGL